MRIPAVTTLALIALSARPLAAQEGGLFTLDPGLSIWTIIVFLIVLFILGKFAWGPILAAVNAREEAIRDSIAEAREAREEASKLLEEHRSQLADARRQAQDILAEGRAAGERIRKELEEKARADSEEIIERARREIQRERDRAMQEIRGEAVDVALAAASRVLGERLDAEADRRLVERFLAEVQSTSGAEG